MKQVIAKGATSQRLYVFVRNNSLTTGLGLTGLVFNTASLSASYVRPGAARTAITLVTQTVTGAFASGGFVEVDATNMPGVYRFDVPDAVFASGVNSAIIMLRGATNMEPVVIEVQLTGVDMQDSVRAGMTALPNVAAAADGGLPTVDASNSVKIRSPFKRNQALANFPFVMLSSTTDLPLAGETVTVTRKIDGATSPTSVGTATDMGNGTYEIDLTATDMDGLTIALRCTSANCHDKNITIVTDA